MVFNLNHGRFQWSQPPSLLGDFWLVCNYVFLCDLERAQSRDLRGRLSIVLLYLKTRICLLFVCVFVSFICKILVNLTHLLSWFKYYVLCLY